MYVNASAPELAPLFRSNAQGEILARLLLNPEQAVTIAELARATSTSYASTHREVQHLVRAGVVTEKRVGRASQVTANKTSPAYGPLTELLLLTYGPAVVVPRVLTDIGAIQTAYIYGSWAARRAGEQGSPPRDIDVLVVGNPARDAVYEAAEEAERILGREVNIRIVSAAAWAKAVDPFIRTVQDRPLVELKGGWS